LRLIKRIKEKLTKKQNNKTFSSYEEALKFCQARTKGAYESTTLSNYRFKKTNNFLNSGGSLLAAPSAPLLMFAINYYLKKESSKTPELIDFGGACGENLILLNKIFSNEIFEKSWIIESPQMVKESKNWEFAKNIQYSSNLNEIITNNNIDIFFTSSCLQYLKNPFEIISQVAKSNIPLVVLARNKFSSNGEIRAQVSYLSENGIGPHLSEYENQAIYYPNTSIKKRKLIDLFLKNGYSILVGSSKEYEFKNSRQEDDLIFSRI
jgi:putative methyltransferase (TIGR04325 family)